MLKLWRSQDILGLSQWRAVLSLRFSTGGSLALALALALQSGASLAVHFEVGTLYEWREAFLASPECRVLELRVRYRLQNCGMAMRVAVAEFVRSTVSS